jgi:predicted Fe-Mo cluster-binding NifX family protein
LRVAIPIKKDEGLNSKVSGHFGMAKYFLIIDLNIAGISDSLSPTGIDLRNSEYYVIQSPPEQGCTTRVDLLIRNKIEILMVEAIGGKPFALFKRQGVTIYDGAIGTIEEVLIKFLSHKLEELKEGLCSDLLPPFRKEN